jgi:hypothetical protein
LDVWLLRYVNQSLNNIEGYKGSVECIGIDLYRGAYRINNLKITKKNGNIPVPFIDIDQADLSIQWAALIHGRIVSNADLYKPIINFAVGKSGTATQMGTAVDWTKPIKDLMPIDVNYVTFKEGTLTYRDYSTKPKVNIFIHNMSGEIKNLRNVVDASEPLPSHFTLQGNSIGGGGMKIEGKMNILKTVPDVDLNTKLENVNLHALSDFSNAYAAVDIKAGNLSVYSRLIIKDDQVSGYIKPIATHLSLIDLHKDANPIKLAWQSVVAVVVQVFTNLPKDQFATKIELKGNLDNINTDTWSAVGGIIRNAFISSLKKGLDPDTKTIKSPASK